MIVKNLEGCNTLCHRVNLRDTEPVKQKVPYHLREESDCQISDFLTADIIEEIDNPYSAQPFLLKKLMVHIT